MRVLPRQGRRPAAAARDAPSPDGGDAARTQTGGRPPAACGAGQPVPGRRSRRAASTSPRSTARRRRRRRRRSAFVADGERGRRAWRRHDQVPSRSCCTRRRATASPCTSRNRRRPVRGPAPRRPSTSPSSPRPPRPSGVNVGFDPEQTVAPGESRTYRYYADVRPIGSAADRRLRRQRHAAARGLYGAFVVAPQGAQFADPAGPGSRATSAPRSTCTCPAGVSYRDFTLLFADNDAVIGGEHDALPDARCRARRWSTTAREPRADDASMFSSRAHGDPATPILTGLRRATRSAIHVVGAPGSEQAHVFSLGGLAGGPTSGSPGRTSSRRRASRPGRRSRPRRWAARGGWSRSAGDMFYGDLRRPFTEAGMWGLLRTVSDAKCPVRPLPGRDCIGEGPIGSSPGGPAPSRARLPTTGTLRAGTQPLEPVTSTRRPLPEPQPRGSSGLVLPSTTSKAQLRRGVRTRRDRPRLHPVLRVELRRAGLEVARGRDRAGRPPRGDGGDDLAVAGAHDRAPADRRLRGQRRGRDRPARASRPG